MRDAIPGVCAIVAGNTFFQKMDMNRASEFFKDWDRSNTHIMCGNMVVL